MQKNNEIKGGLVREAAIVAGMKIAQKSARRWGRMARQFGAEEDSLGAAYEALVKAWECWDGHGDWAQHARNWCDELAKREVNKLRSVVQTNYTRRRIVADAGMVVATGDGWTYRDVEQEESSVEDRLIACEALTDVRATLEAAADQLSGAAAGAMSRDVVSRILAGEDGESLADIAARHGYTRMSAYRVEAALREAL